MAKIKLDLESLRQINLFHMITKVVPKDCLIENDRILFIVKEGMAASAIGRKGINIKKLESITNKKIEVLEFNKDLLKFLNNIFRPLRIKEIKSNEIKNKKRMVIISIESNGHNINPRIFIMTKVKKTKPILKKYFDIDDIKVQ